MPGFDRTGPRGCGRMTGRRLGQCSRDLTEKISESGEETGIPETSPIENPDNVVYGAGRGGVPYGCGQGFCGGRSGRGRRRRCI
ncbi:hypothetical protein J2128_001707 [Methanomicrobium sp. W14]|uniref:DUF5320 domain-containing protein n=1 Tax=Methanomicrobium sp. W14 TaxID=2817839 RepID=UPI001AE973D8|nr:DUF5320 domain-containing protein [Methanomicrobium sp. W14]MBP2133753.1 hypothetical protein [Methanomicrobium sp. W14]